MDENAISTRRVERTLILSRWEAGRKVDMPLL
jgi:hypothetical protein